MSLTWRLIFNKSMLEKFNCEFKFPHRPAVMLMVLLALLGGVCIPSRPTAQEGAANSEGASTPASTFVRAVLTIFGIGDPENIYNVRVRISKLPDVSSFHFDIRNGRLTIDFRPGIEISREALREEMARSGFKVKIDSVDKIPVSNRSDE